MPFRPPIGISDFPTVREYHHYFVDKSHFVSDVLDASSAVLLFPRPRRFGKTLNLSMLQTFVEKTGEDRSPLFEGLSVWSDEKARKHFQRYPVVFLTFKDIKTRAWSDCREALARCITRYVRNCRPTLDSVATPGSEQDDVQALASGTASNAALWSSLGLLSDLLHRATGERVVILIDEYDTPIHAGYANGYYDEIIEFMRNFLSDGLKDNRHLFKGVLTGILRVAKESIFSGLNNLTVHSLLSPQFATAFGFEEAEVEAIAREADIGDVMSVVRAWYNGYTFGGKVIYNPWSVLNFFDNPSRPPQPYWASTSSDDILRTLLLRGGNEVSAAMERLLRGESVVLPVQENIVLRQLDDNPDAIWSFLLFSGYLKPGQTLVHGRSDEIPMAVPNEEVAIALQALYREFMSRGFRGVGQVTRALGDLMAGRTEPFARMLTAFMKTSLSFHDFAGAEPERVYQALILGMLVVLAPTHDVRSNRESGDGRYDVMILPKQPGQPAVVLELKVPGRKETPEQALQTALVQIREKDYAAEARARGAAPIHEIAVVFDGKDAWVGKGEGRAEG